MRLKRSTEDKDNTTASLDKMWVFEFFYFRVSGIETEQCSGKTLVSPLWENLPYADRHVLE